MSVVTRRERLRADTEEQIVTAARTILTDEGLPSVTLRAIAGRVGMTAPALYRYVASRDEIVRRMCEAICDDLADRLSVAVDDAGDRPPLDRAIALIRAYRAWAVERPEEFTLVFTSSEPGVLDFWDPARVPDDPVCQAFIGVTAELLADNADPGSELGSDLAGAVNAVDLSMPEVRWAIGWWERLHGAVMLEVHRRFPFSTATGDVVFDTILDDLAADVRRLRADHG